MADYRDFIYGASMKVPTKNGLKRYINFDNAASTPPFKSVLQLICEEAKWYSSIHRGAGYKSKYCTAKFEAARASVAAFCRADLEEQIVIFTKNTTEAINKVSHYLDCLPGEFVVFTKMDHHSNELPWRILPHYCIGLRDCELDLNELEAVLKTLRGRIKLVAVSGASNVTGYIPPIHTIAEMTHAAGAKILVDGAQLVPHRPVNIYPQEDPRHLDFLAFSGHKMYAPFGCGVLIGPKDIFDNPPPSQVGGGTVKGIGPGGIIWASPPDIEEAGSPNLFGALTIAQAMETLTAIGWENLIAHETELLQYTLERLRQIPGITLYHEKPWQRVGVVSFNLTGYHHAQVAEYLSASRGIGVRSGCFCARGFIQSLLGLDKVAVTDPNTTPGMVRVSFGCYNRIEEVDILDEALHELIHGPPAER